MLLSPPWLFPGGASGVGRMILGAGFAPWPQEFERLAEHFLAVAVFAEDFRGVAVSEPAIAVMLLGYFYVAGPGFRQEENDDFEYMLSVPPEGEPFIGLEVPDGPEILGADARFFFRFPKRCFEILFLSFDVSLRKIPVAAAVVEDEEFQAFRGPAEEGDTG